MNESPKPVPAATVLIVRDGDAGMEVFMVVRHHQIDFASGALVFPGGKVDAGDFEVRDHCRVAADTSDEQVAMMAGAIREAFEECGVLLARRKGEEKLVSGDEVAALEHCRDKLNQHELTLTEFLVNEHLELACDTLQHFAHWITPDMMPKRFDTHFYLAHAPADHVALHDGGESVDSIWITPDDALKGNADGTYTIIFPTRLNVELLGEANTVADVFQQARERNIVPVLPWTEQRDDGNYLCIPADAGYQISEEKMAGPPA